MHNINIVLLHNICTGCGICEALCPNDAINFIVQNGRLLPSIDDHKCRNSKGCHRCYDACPGVGIDLVRVAKNLFVDENMHENKYLGRYVACFTGCSANQDLRYHAASGGMVSQFLIWLLENDKIDGAIVTKFVKEAPLKVKSFIATSKEDILASKSSKYAPVSLHSAVKELREAKGKQYVVVGVPCHIEGMRKLMAIDKRIREKVVGLFAIYCSGSRTFCMTEYIMKEHKIDINSIDYLSYRDNGCLGGMVVKGKNVNFYEDYQRYCHPLRTMFHPRRCLFCVDHFGELADVSFGDIHIKPFSDDKIGINSVVTRTTYWQQLLKEAEKSGCLTLKPLDVKLLLESQKMAKIKKTRYIGYCLLNKKLGRTVPDYGTTYGIKLSMSHVIDYIKNSVDRYIGCHKRLWFLIPVIKSKVYIH